MKALIEDNQLIRGMSKGLRESFADIEGKYFECEKTTIPDYYTFLSILRDVINYEMEVINDDEEEF